MRIPETAKDFKDSLDLINHKIKKTEEKLKGSCSNIKIDMGTGETIEWSPEDERIMIQSWNDYCPLRYSSIQTRVNSLDYLDKF